MKRLGAMSAEEALGVAATSAELAGSTKGVGSEITKAVQSLDSIALEIPAIRKLEM